MILSILAAGLVFACEPASVVSGDTLQCEGRTVRLVGIRAEEPGAAEALRRIVGGHPTVCRTEGAPADAHVVARCWNRAHDLGCFMLRAGLAVAPDPRRPACH